MIRELLLFYIFTNVIIALVYIEEKIGKLGYWHLDDTRDVLKRLIYGIIKLIYNIIKKSIYRLLTTPRQRRQKTYDFINSFTQDIETNEDDNNES